VEYYHNQLKELFSLYGPVYQVWFDMANGGSGYYGGARETRNIRVPEYYDWPGTISLVRSMEPEILVFGPYEPDIRWCGNEKGYVGDPNWCTLTIDSIHDTTDKKRKRIIKIDEPVETKMLRVNITGSKACPLISNAEIYI
jgi:alpha-L-fucosidase